MKTYSTALGVLAICAAALASCQKEAALEQNVRETVSAGFTAALSEEDQTKTSVTINGNSATFHWDANDKLAVRQIYYRNNNLFSEVSVSDTPVWKPSEGYYSLSAAFTAVSPAPSAHFTGGNKYMYQGFYPASNVTEGSDGKVQLTLPSQQTPGGEQSFDPQADILYADAVYSKSQRSKTISDRTINGFTFHRLSAIGVMHISGSPSALNSTGAAVQYVEFISTQDKTLAGTYTFDVDNPNAAGTPSHQFSSIRVNFAGVTTNRNNLTVIFTCLPANCNGFKVRVMTTKGMYEKTFDTTQNFVQGQANFFNVSMSDAQFSKTVRLMTYNVAAFRVYDQFNLKHLMYKDSIHYWKRPGQNNYVRYNQADYDSNKKDNTGEAIITHAANILATQVNQDADLPTYIGFNELDCNLVRKLTAKVNLRATPESEPHEATGSIYVTHGYQIKQMKERMEAVTRRFWNYHFGAARKYGTLIPGFVANGEPEKKYGNGVLTSQAVLSTNRFELGQGGNTQEETRCIAIVETADCIFGSVHMGGVNVKTDAERCEVIANQIQQMETALRRYDQSTKPVFVCGDFNAYPTEVATLMSPTKWRLLSTTSTPTHSTNCLDYIFVYKNNAPQVQVIDSEVIQVNDTNIAPYGITSVSDHKPIWVTVRLSQ